MSMVTASETEIFKKPYSYLHGENAGGERGLAFCDRRSHKIFNGENRLEQMSSGGVTERFLYDFDGNLVQHVSGAGVTTQYVYASGPAPVAEINVNTAQETDFIQASGKTWGAMKTIGNTYFHMDQVGSVVALSNASGVVTDTYEYDPFGKVLDHQGTSNNDYLFVGGRGVRRLTANLDFMGVREYQVSTGRFTTQDPIGFAGGMNLFSYVRNNPLKLVDPAGLDPYDNPAGAAFQAQVNAELAVIGGFISCLGDFVGCIYSAPLPFNPRGACEEISKRASEYAAKKAAADAAITAYIAHSTLYYEDLIKARDAASLARVASNVHGLVRVAGALSLIYEFGQCGAKLRRCLSEKCGY